MRLIAIVANIAVLAFLSQPAVAARVWVFGDSNVDSGWYRVKPFSGNAKFDADLARSFVYDIGRPTSNPGPMSVEVLAALLGTDAAPANQGGTNYATSGAKNVNMNTPLNGGFPNAVPTRTQISGFLHNRLRPGRDVPIRALLWREPVDEDVFVVDSGANDIGFARDTAQSGFTFDQQTAYLEDQATALAEDIESLQKRGARQIIVVGQPESFGAAGQQSLRQFYDSALRAALDALSVQYAWADANQVRLDIENKPGTFHIVNLGNAAGQVACPEPDPVLGITTAWALLCSARSPVTQPTATADQSLFADDQHWSAAAQKVLGAYFYCLVRSTWPNVGGPQLPFPQLPFPWLHSSPKPPYACSDFTGVGSVPAAAAAE